MRPAMPASRTRRRWTSCVSPPIGSRPMPSSSRRVEPRLFAEILGPESVRTDAPAFDIYGQDALGIGHRPDAVVFPADTAQVAAVARLCNDHRVPLVVRGGGTGYTGGAVPTHGGVVLSMERLNRILEID